jgi:hypothetical protein
MYSTEALLMPSSLATAAVGGFFDTCIHYKTLYGIVSRNACDSLVTQEEGDIIGFIFGCPGREETQRCWPAGPLHWVGGWESKLL